MDMGGDKKSHRVICGQEARNSHVMRINQIFVGQIKVPLLLAHLINERQCSFQSLGREL